MSRPPHPPMKVYVVSHRQRCWMQSDHRVQTLPSSLAYIHRAACFLAPPKTRRAGFSHAGEAPLQADRYSHLLVANADSTEQEYLSLAHAWSAHQKCLEFALRRAQHGRLLPSDVAGKSL